MLVYNYLIIWLNLLQHTWPIEQAYLNLYNSSMSLSIIPFLPVSVKVTLNCSCLYFEEWGVFLGHGNKSACCFVLYYKSNVYCTCFYCSLEQRFSFIGHIISDHIWFSTPCLGTFFFFFLKNFKLFWFPIFWPWTIKVLCVLNLISMFLSIHLYM